MGQPEAVAAATVDQKIDSYLSIEHLHWKSNLSSSKQESIHSIKMGSKAAATATATMQVIKVTMPTTTMHS